MLPPSSATRRRSAVAALLAAQSVPLLPRLAIAEDARYLDDYVSPKGYEQYKVPVRRYTSAGDVRGSSSNPSGRHPKV